MKVRPYLIIMRNSVMACLAYRAHFFFTLLGTAIYLIVSWFLWKAIYANGGTIGGMTLTQAFLYVGISMSLFGFMQTAADWFLHNIVASGDFIRFITKPMDFPMQLFFDSLGGGIMNMACITLPALVLVFLFSAAPLPSLGNILLFIPAIAIGFLLNFFFDFLAGLTVFVTHSIGGIATIKEMTVLLLSGAVIPLPFFPKGIRTVLEWLPFQAVYNIPVRLLTADTLQADDVLLFFLKQTAWLLVFFLLSRLLFSAALRKVVVNGG